MCNVWTHFVFVSVCSTCTCCNTLQHTATHCSTVQHTATHCNTLQHTAAHCNASCGCLSMFKIHMCLCIKTCVQNVETCMPWHIDTCWTYTCAYVSMCLCVQHTQVSVRLGVQHTHVSLCIKTCVYVSKHTRFNISSILRNMMYISRILHVHFCSNQNVSLSLYYFCI